MNRTIQQRRRRIADQPRIGDTIVVQERNITSRLTVRQVSADFDFLSPGVLALTLYQQFLRAPGMWSFGGHLVMRHAGHWWTSWPQLVRRALTTEEGQP